MLKFTFLDSFLLFFKLFSIRNILMTISMQLDSCDPRHMDDACPCSRK